jgi:hypothetical protein
MAEVSEKRKQYVEEWQKKNIRRVVVKLNKRVDADIIEQLDKQDSVQGYIKQAIRAYME